MYNYNAINEVHLEVTQRCNASCPMCDRNVNGGEVNPHIKGKEAELTLDHCIDIFPHNYTQCICVVTWEILLVPGIH